MACGRRARHRVRPLDRSTCHPPRLRSALPCLTAGPSSSMVWWVGASRAWVLGLDDVRLRKLELPSQPWWETAVAVAHVAWMMAWTQRHPGAIVTVSAAILAALVVVGFLLAAAYNIWRALRTPRPAPAARPKDD